MLIWYHSVKHGFPHNKEEKEKYITKHDVKTWFA